MLFPINLFGYFPEKARHGYLAVFLHKHFFCLLYCVCVSGADGGVCAKYVVLWGRIAVNKMQKVKLKQSLQYFVQHKFKGLAFLAFYK